MKAAWITAALAALAASAAPALADVRAGVEAWQRGDYRKAVEEWRPLAIAGDADAQFNLGQAYKLGRGVPLDPGLAEQWFGKAAVQKHPQAEVNYGLALFQNGKRDEAAPWLEKAAMRGEPRAQLVFGTMLFNGDGVQRDWVRAYALITRAAAAGIPKAAETQAQMDQYIDTDMRQKGIALARQYESQGSSTTAPLELAGSDRGVRPAELPPSQVGEDPTQLTRPKPGATKPPRVVTTKPVPTPPPAVTAPTPTPRPTPTATVAKPAPGKGWRVQLGAFRDDNNARNLWATLRGRVSALADATPVFARSGDLTRLQAGPFAASADAARVCAAVKASVPGTACVPVAP
ncbi:MAG: sporulation protein [Sphingobium sp.]|nr:sporulation protein [Sphingobium sp.]